MCKKDKMCGFDMKQNRKKKSVFITALNVSTCMSIVSWIFVQCCIHVLYPVQTIKFDRKLMLNFWHMCSNPYMA